MTYNPSSIDALNLLGLCYYRLGKFKNAEYFWVKSIEIESSTNRAIVYLDDLKMDMKVVEPVYSAVLNYDALCYLAHVKEDRLSELKYKLRNLTSFITKG